MVPFHVKLSCNITRIGLFVDERDGVVGDAADCSTLHGGTEVPASRTHMCRTHHTLCLVAVA